MTAWGFFSVRGDVDAVAEGGLVRVRTHVLGRDGGHLVDPAVARMLASAVRGGFGVSVDGHKAGGEWCPRAEAELDEDAEDGFVWTISVGPMSVRMPHSRANDLADELDAAAAVARATARSAEAGE